MHILIDIDEDAFKARQHWVANQKRMVDEVDVAIANGIPLDKIRVEIRKKMRFDSFNEGIVSFDDISKIFDKYKTNSGDL